MLTLSIVCGIMAAGVYCLTFIFRSYFLMVIATFFLALCCAFAIDHNNRTEPMQIETVNYVFASTLFQDCPEAQSQFNAADHSEVSWGDASHTLINQETFLAMLNDAELTEEELKATNHPMKMIVVGQLNTIYQRLDTLGDSTLIDLEN